MEDEKPFINLTATLLSFFNECKLPNMCVGTMKDKGKKRKVLPFDNDRNQAQFG